MNISSQDYRNAYEKFYSAMRHYLWPYSTIEELAEVEVDIYTAFIDTVKLRADLSKLYSSIRDVCKDDDRLKDTYKSLSELLDTRDPSPYVRLLRVQETDPNEPKQLKLADKEKGDEYYEDNEEETY